MSAVHRTPGMSSSHFTSYVLVNNVWHFYDDAPARKNPVFKEIGDYDDLLEYNGQEIMDCVMYFYEPK